MDFSWCLGTLDKIWFLLFKDKEGKWLLGATGSSAPYELCQLSPKLPNFLEHQIRFDLLSFVKRTDEI